MEEKPKREIKMNPKGGKYKHLIFPDPIEELRLRFAQKKLEDMLNDNMGPFPTIIAEMEDPEFLELIRPFVMFSPMKPFTCRVFKPATIECLETKKIKSYGELYILVNPN